MKWILLILGLGYYGYSKAKNYVDALSMSLKSFNFDHAGNGLQFWNVVLRFTNPLPADITVNGFNVDFFLKGKKIGNAFKNEKFVIPANSNSDFKATVATSLITALPDVINNFLNHKTNDFTFVGTVNAYGFNIPVNINYSV